MCRLIASALAGCLGLIAAASAFANPPTQDTTEPTPAESSPMPTAAPSAGWQLITDGHQFPEGPAWNGRDALFFSNCNGGTVMRIAHGRAGATVFLAASTDPPTFSKTNGLTFGADGALYGCDFGNPSIVRLAMDGTATVLARACDDGTALVRPNDLAFDPAGHLYFTDSWAYKRENPQGAVYRIDAQTGAVTRAAGALAFANGLAFSADAKTLFVAESAWNRVLKFPVLPDGSLGQSTVFADMPGGDPDGMAVDVAGNLYVAHFGAGHVVVFAPDGQVLRRIPTPGKQPSNVEFAGPDLKTLYLTEDETNGVYTMSVEVPGLRLFHGPTGS